ncbi:hypothetical protein D3C72_1371290 [compost metagenome]
MQVQRPGHGHAYHVLHQDIGQQDDQENHQRLAAALEHAQVGAQPHAAEEHQQQHRLHAGIDDHAEIRARRGHRRDDGEQQPAGDGVGDVVARQDADAAVDQGADQQHHHGGQQ